MINIIKIIFFKIFIIIFVGTSLNSTPTILLQTDNNPTHVDININIPKLVLAQIEDEFPQLDVGSAYSFYIEPQWAKLWKWNNEPIGKLYILDVIDESKINSSWHFRLAFHIYKYTLEGNEKITSESIIKLMDDNPSTPIILNFTFAKKVLNVDEFIDKPLFEEFENMDINLN